MRASSACMRSRATSCDRRPAVSCFNSTIFAEPRLTSFCISSIWSIIFWLFARSRRSCFSSSATASAMSSLGGGGGEVGGGGDGGGDRGT